MRAIARLPINTCGIAGRFLPCPGAGRRRHTSSIRDLVKAKEDNVQAYKHAHELSHVDSKGNPTMVNVSHKAVTARRYVPHPIVGYPRA